MIYQYAAFAIALSVSAAAQTQSASGIINGGFEIPAPPLRGYRNIPVGTQFAGWRVIGTNGQVATVSTSFVSQRVSFVAHGGASWLDLTGISMRQTGVEQEIATAVGQRYRMTYYIGNVVDGGIYGRDTTVAVFIDGRLATTSTNSSGMPGRHTWQRFTHEFAAAGPRTRIAFVNGDPPGDNTAGLDDVSIEKVAR